MQSARSPDRGLLTYPWPRPRAARAPTTWPRRSAGTELPTSEAAQFPARLPPCRRSGSAGGQSSVPGLGPGPHPGSLTPARTEAQPPGPRGRPRQSREACTGQAGAAVFSRQGLWEGRGASSPAGASVAPHAPWPWPHSPVGLSCPLRGTANAARTWRPGQLRGGRGSWMC